MKPAGPTPSEAPIHTVAAGSSSEAARLVPGGRAQPPRVPDYEVIRRIGVGAYGEVWLARNVFGEYRAIKMVWRASFGEDDRPFQREFEGIKRFEPISRSHPSQLAILHVGNNEEANCFYYVMELADPVPALNQEHETRDPKAGRSANAEGDC